MTAQGTLIEMEREECLRLLASVPVGRVAVTMPTGPPVIRPVNFVFDRSSQSVVFRSAWGSKLNALIRSAEAAFEVDGIDGRARTGWSVIVQGPAEEVSHPYELGHLSNLGVEPWPAGTGSHWVRIRARTVSGRRVGPGPAEHAHHRDSPSALAS